MDGGTMPDPRWGPLIRRSLPILPVRQVPELRLHLAAPGSGLRRLVEGAGLTGTPYWAYTWAGGLALSRFVLDHPAVVSGRRVVDLGAGSGLVGIAAARAGAATIRAAETDALARTALALNAGLNGAVLGSVGDDLLDGPAPRADLILVGDLFYEATLARRVTAFLDRCRTAGLEVLVGDPGRTALPRDRLRMLERYATGDVDKAEGVDAAVFRFEKG